MQPHTSRRTFIRTRVHRIYTTMAAQDVVHIKQTGNWDCGLVCTEMSLRSLNKQHCSLKELHSLCQTSSTWTIDLAYLLHHFGVEFAFTTITVGVNNDYASESFYKQDWDADTARVQRLFEQVEQYGITLLERRVSNELLADHVENGNLAIVLVDSRLIVCDTCGNGCGCLTTIASALSSGNFLGHYVLVCGYDRSSDTFEYADPGIRAERCHMSGPALLAARTSYGTDEDLLLLFVDGGKSEFLERLGARERVEDDYGGSSGSSGKA